MRATVIGALVLAGAFAGCVGPTVVATVPTPALVPLRTFPVIVLAPGPRSAERRIGEALARHLRGDGREVRLVDQASIEAMRQRGELPPASVVVGLEVEELRASRTRLGNRPETVCGPAGCYTRGRPDSYQVPTLRMRARLTVFEGPTGRPLQRLGVEAQEEGRSYARMRDRAVQQLLGRLRTMVDPHVERVSVRLRSVDLPAVEPALEEMRRGRWHRARRRLEALVRSEGFGRLGARERARVWYDLGVARRFDPETFARDPERHFRAAETALRRALRLDPDPAYDRALADLLAHRERARLLRAQQQAAEHNFRLGPAAPPMPLPPPGYGQQP